MRGPISDEPETLSAAAPLSGAIPAVYREDPLFMQLCAAFDDLIAPLVTAVDCFDAYLDPHLAPADYLPWLAELVGYQSTNGRPADPDRDRIASAVRDHGRRGTSRGVREAAAHAANVPIEQVRLDDPGGTRWSTRAGGATTAATWPPPTEARIHVQPRHTPEPASAHQDPENLRSTVQAAIDEATGVHVRITVDVYTAEQHTDKSGVGDSAQQPRRARPDGARTYGGEEP